MRLTLSAFLVLTSFQALGFDLDSFESRFHRISRWRMNTIRLLSNELQRDAFLLICRANFGSRYTDSYSIVTRSDVTWYELVCTHIPPRRSLTQEEIDRQNREFAEVARRLNEEDQRRQTAALNRGSYDSLSRTNTKTDLGSSSPRTKDSTSVRSE